jgi:hypothetical protein
MKIVLYATCCIGIVFSSVASAQVCQASNSTLNGTYGFVANELSLDNTTGTGTTTTGAGGTTGTTTGSTTGTTTTGTTTTGSGTSSSGFSTTTLGELLGGIASNNQLSLAGRLVFDGAGNVSAAPTSASGAAVQVGTYNVNSNCTITVTLKDAFGTNTTSTTLVGIVLGGGSEIDLINTTNQSTTPGNTGGTSTGGTSTGGTSTGATSTTSTTQFGSQLAIKLVRILLPYGCSASNLTGLYGFVLTGVSQTASTTTGTGTTTSTGTGTTTSTGTTTGTGTTTLLMGPFHPFTLIGELVFDGQGNIIASQPATAGGSSTSIGSGTSTSGTGTTPSTTQTPVQMALASLQFTGTYTLNSDCSGTLTISNSSATGTTTGTGTTTTTGTGTTTTGMAESFTANFVLTQPDVTVTNGTNLNNYRLAPAIEFTSTGANEIATGYALPE